MKRFFYMLAVLSVLLWPVYSSADLVSTFDRGAEGWTVTGDVHPIEWESSGGNPGGYIKAVDDATGQWWFFASPSTWQGDWTQYINGTLSFDLTLIQHYGNWDNNQDAVRIYYGSNQAQDFYAWGKNMINHPAQYPSWSSYEITIDSTTFTNPDGTPIDAATFNSNMSHVTELWIRGEYINGGDTEGLDNVQVRAVPIPGAVWLLGSGLIGLVVANRKRIL